MISANHCNLRCKSLGNSTTAGPRVAQYHSSFVFTSAIEDTKNKNKSRPPKRMTAEHLLTPTAKERVQDIPDFPRQERWCRTIPVIGIAQDLICWASEASLLSRNGLGGPIYCQRPPGWAKSQESCQVSFVSYSSPPLPPLSHTVATRLDNILGLPSIMLFGAETPFRPLCDLFAHELVSWC